MRPKLNFVWIFLIPALFFLISLITLNHYGINWDEPYHYRRGQAFLQYLLTGKKDYSNTTKYPPLKGDSDNPDFRNAQANFKSVQDNPSLASPLERRSFYQDDSWNGEYFIDIENSNGHPALNGVLASIFNKVFYQKLGILGDLESYRLFIILAVSAMIMAVALFMYCEFGIVASVFTSLVLATYPLVLGEQHFNIKDPVEMSFYTITVIAAYLGIRKNKLHWMLISGVFFAFAMATKFNILFSPIILLIWIIYYVLRMKKKVNKAELFKNLIIASVIAAVLSFAVLIATYPALWKNVIDGLLSIFLFYKKVGYPTQQFINFYPITWILFTTPPAALFLFFVAIFHLRTLVKKNSFVLLLLIWLIVVIGRNSLFGALSYGGVRLIMEFVPAFAMLSGIGAAHLITLKKDKRYLALSSVLLLLAFSPTVVKLINIHPNENVYFNFLIGGLAGAKKANITSWGDSYGNAYFQGVLWLNAHAEQNARVSTPIGNTSNVPRFKLRKDIAVSPYYWSGLLHQGEYLIELTYNYPPMNYFALKYLNEAMIPVYEVKVDEIAIAKVWKNDPSFVKEKYKNTKKIQTKVASDTPSSTLHLSLPNIEDIMAIEIIQPTKNCAELTTGWVETSQDGKNWTREPEDIASDQLKRGEKKKLATVYNFYFFQKSAKFIKFNTSDSNSCLLQAQSAVVTVLAPNQQ